MFEFSQAAYRAFGPIEHESLAALAERGFRFSMDHVTDLRMEPQELADRCVPLPQGAGQAAARPRRPARRATSIRRTSPTCWRAPASTSSPSASRARARWSICSITTCASARASCSRRRGRCGPRRCKPRRRRGVPNAADRRLRRRPSPRPLIRALTYPRHDACRLCIPHFAAARRPATTRCCATSGAWCITASTRFRAPATR